MLHPNSSHFRERYEIALAALKRICAEETRGKMRAIALEALRQLGRERDGDLADETMIGRLEPQAQREPDLNQPSGETA